MLVTYGMNRTQESAFYFRQGMIQRYGQTGDIPFEGIQTAGDFWSVSSCFIFILL